MHEVLAPTRREELRTSLSVVEFRRRMMAKPLIGRAHYVPPERYDIALGNYVNLVGAWGTVRAVYRIGSVGVPGLSDIDLVVVMKDGERDTLARYSVTRLDAEDRYLFCHDPLFTGAQEFRSLPLWFPTDTATLVHGVPTELERGGWDARTVKLIHLCQLLVCYQLQLLRDFAYDAEALHERITESLIKGFCNSIALWAGAADDSTAVARYADFSEEYLAFRRGWFELDEKDRTDRFLDHVATATVLALELIEDVAALLLRRWFRGRSELSGCEILMGRNRISFSGAWAASDGAAAILQPGTLSLPTALAMFIYAYREAPGPIGAHVVRMFGCRSGARLEYCEAITREAVTAHQQAVATYAEFMRHKFCASPNPFITFWAPYTRNRLVRLYDRACNRMRGMMPAGITVTPGDEVG